MTVTDRIRDLIVRWPVVDGHNDLAWELRNRVRYDLDALDIGRDQRATGLHTDLPRLRAGGVGAQFWSVWVSCATPDPVTATLEQIDGVYAMIRRYRPLVFAGSADDVEQARESGRIASLLGMEGGHSIAGSLGTLRMMYALGVRYMTLTHVRNTPWADSATDAPAVGGLAPFGHEVVREMNRLGMMVDLSHVAPATMHAALDTSCAPAFFSHSSARALCDHPRNVPDDVLARVRDTNGLVMVTFVPGFLNAACTAWMRALFEEEDRLAETWPEGSPEHRALRDAWMAANPRPPCGVADVADHICHVRDIAGIDTVGLGGDYDGMACGPDGLQDVTGYPSLLAELADRGWSDAELAKLTWSNAVRVLRDTESAARTLANRTTPAPARA